MVKLWASFINGNCIFMFYLFLFIATSSLRCTIYMPFIYHGFLNVQNDFLSYNKITNVSNCSQFFFSKILINGFFLSMHMIWIYFCNNFLYFVYLTTIILKDVLFFCYILFYSTYELWEKLQPCLNWIFCTDVPVSVYFLKWHLHGL